MSVARLDRSTSLKAKITKEGFLKSSSIVTRAGVFLYQNEDGTLRRELRHPDDVFNTDSLESMKMLPITNDHPHQKIVTSENFKELVIGYTGEQVNIDQHNIIANLIISDSKAIKTIKDFGKRELSLGYSTDLVPESGTFEGQPYDFRQTNIKYNHLSLVDKARAGSSARIHLDSGDAIQIDTGENQMDEKTTTIVLDHTDYKVQPEVSKAFQSEKSKSEELTKKLSEQDAKLVSHNKDLEALKAERDGLRQKLDSLQIDESAITARVKERRSYEKVAEKVLTTAQNIDEMSNLEIQAAVIAQKFPKQNLDGKSADYLKALYDVAIEDLEKAPADLSKKMVAVDSAQALNSLQEAQEKQRLYLQNNYKGA